MKRVYIRFINPFGDKKRRNFRRMRRQAMRNCLALKANAANSKINLLLVRMEVVYVNYNTVYLVWYASHGPSKGETKGFNDVIALLAGKLDDWQYGITKFYKPDSKEFVILFPNQRKDFYSGSQIDRLVRIQSLATTMKAYTDLAEIMADVNTYATLLATTLETKEIKQDDVEASSAALIAAYDEMAKYLWMNMNDLINIFIDDPEQVANYFDMALLQKSISQGDGTTIVLTLGVNEKAAYAIDYVAGLKLLLTNMGKVVLYYYFAETENAPTPDTLYQIILDEETELEDDVLKVAANKFIIFVNSDTKKKGKIEIFREK